MNFSDMLRTAYKNTKNRKKNTIITILILILLTIIIFTCLTINNMMRNYINDFYYFSYSARLYNLEYTDETINIEELKEKLEKIEGIIKVINTSESQISGVKLQNNIFGNGTLTLIGANNETLPKLVNGKTFDYNNNKIQLICPNKINTTTMGELFDMGYINTDEHIGKTILLKFDKFDKASVSIGNKPTVIQTYEYEAIIVGTYDAFRENTFFNSCFTNFEFVKQLNDINKWSNYEGLLILINDYRNYDTINENLKLIMDEYNTSYNLSMTSQIDYEMVNQIVYSSTFILLLCSFIATFIEAILISKNIKKRQGEIQVYKTLGYTNNTIKKMFVLENLILLLISFIISFILLYFIIKTIKFIAIKKYCSLLIFNFNLPIISIAIAFLISIIIITFTTILLLNLKQNTR